MTSKHPDVDKLLRKRIYRGMSAEEALAAEARHRRTLEVLGVLLLVQFLASLANTIIANAMPVIVADIGGTQGQYTLIITTGILANTVTTPIAGKLADLFDKKKLFIAAIAIFMAGSLLAGMATSAAMLICFRVLQGAGMGMLITMTQVIMAAIVPPRERGRYNGYMGAMIAVATVSGPLIGGFIVDIPWLGWRWCYWCVLPFLIAALWGTIVRLKIPYTRKDHVRLDFLGAAFIGASASLLVIWVTVGGRDYPWGSAPSLALVSGAVIAAIAFVITESRVSEPLIPLWILSSKVVVLAIIASVGLGSAMFGTNVFLGQYFQYGLGKTPTMSGLLGLPSMAGVIIASTWAGRAVTRRGTWKEFVVGGMILMALGTAGLSFVHAETPVPFTMVMLLVMGLGLGSANANLILAVQNSVGLTSIGAATSTLTFFRTLSGAIGIQVLGIVYGHAVQAEVGQRLGAAKAADLAGSGSSLNLASLPPQVEGVIRTGYGDAFGTVMLVVTGLTVIGVIAVCFMDSTRLRDTVDLDKKVEKVVQGLASDVADEAGEDSARDTALDTASNAGEGVKGPH